MTSASSILRLAPSHANKYTLHVWGDAQKHACSEEERTQWPLRAQWHDNKGGDGRERGKDWNRELERTGTHMRRLRTCENVTRRLGRGLAAVPAFAVVTRAHPSRSWWRSPSLVYKPHHPPPPSLTHTSIIYRSRLFSVHVFFRPPIIHFTYHPLYPSP